MVAEKDQSQPLLRFLSAIVFYTCGLLYWFYCLLNATRTGHLFSRESEQAKLKLRIQQDRLWNLNKQPNPGFYHAFFKLRDGHQLHYICNRRNITSKGNLCIFLHGYPDTCMTWRHLTAEPSISALDATIICVDLPGFGGSDSFERYDIQVLEALTEFVVAMRERYTSDSADSDQRTILIGHDWGAFLSYRLAAEASCLADRYIVINGPHVELVNSNRDRVLHSAIKIFKQFRQSPYKNFKCLGKAVHALQPLLRQMLMSGYIFAFHLHVFLVQQLLVGGNSRFMRRILELEEGETFDQAKQHESYAATIGPSVDDCKTSIAIGKEQDKIESYGPTVLGRARSRRNALYTQTAYYRDGLVSQVWEKSLESIALIHELDVNGHNSASPMRRRSLSASSSLHLNKYNHCLKAPATVIFGEKDIALTRQFCFDGIGDFLARDSEAILLPRTGHWPQIEKAGRAVLAKLIQLHVSSDIEPKSYVGEELKKMYPDLQVVVKK